VSRTKNIRAVLRQITVAWAMAINSASDGDQPFWPLSRITRLIPWWS
jgi:hypothetical protein